MRDYPMLYENIVLAAYGHRMQRQDPHKLGDANILTLAKEGLYDKYGQQAKQGLSYAINEVVKNYKDTAVAEMLLRLDEKIPMCRSIGEFYKILEKVEELFESVGVSVP
jgi:hypothetical protein